MIRQELYSDYDVIKKYIQGMKPHSHVTCILQKLQEEGYLKEDIFSGFKLKDFEILIIS